MELRRLGFSSTGHTRELIVHAEIVLDGDGRHSLSFLLDGNALFGFESLMQSIGVAASGHQASGMLIDDHNFAILNDVVDIFLKEAVRLEQLAQVMETLALGGKLLLKSVFALGFLIISKGLIGVDAVDLSQHIGHDEGVGVVGTDGIASLSGEVGFIGLFVDGEVEDGLDLLDHSAVVVAADSGFDLFQLLEDLSVFEDMEQLLMGRHTEFHLKQFDKCFVNCLFGSVLIIQNSLCLARQTAAEHILLGVELGNRSLQLVKLVGGHRNGSGNDQRCTRLVDKDAVDLVDDSVVVIALDKLLGTVRHTHIAQVVETELAVGSVGDVAGILRAADIRALHILQTSNGESEEGINLTHPARVAQGKVVVDRDQLAVASGKGVEVERKCRHKSFSLTGSHLGDSAAVQSDTAHKLDIKGNHIPDNRLSANFKLVTNQTAAGVFHCCECLAHQVIKRFTFGVTLLEFQSLSLELLISKLLVLLFDPVDLRNQRTHTFHVTLTLGSEYRFDNSIKHQYYSLKISFIP